jgi:hypothetical protein
LSQEGDPQVTYVARPVEGTGGLANHGPLFVHEGDDPATADIRAQFSLQGGNTEFDPQDSTSGTFQTDRAAFRNRGGENLHFRIATPKGMTPKQFADTVTRLGNSYQANPSTYNLFRGPNSNSAAAFPLYRSGATVPQVPRSPGLNFYAPR